MSHRDMSEIIRHQIPLAVRPDTTVQETCKRMYARKMGAALVTNEKGILVGIFTGRDAVRVLSRGRDPGEVPVKQAMTKSPETIAPKSHAIEALRLMRDGGFRHLPVVQDGTVLGIVSRGDFRGMEQDRLDHETGIWERIG
jgi:CBS domain-containing protein